MSGLRLMAVHAHPDDESSKGAATLARYTAAGHRVMVVTLTGGERGDILNPAMDLPDVHGHIAEIRRDEMAKAAEILGVEHHWLGFVDSGLPKGDPLPPLPEDCFALVPLEVSAAVAEFLSGHPAVSQVRYPGLADHPGHRVAAAQMRGFGGMVSVRMRGGRAAAEKLCAGTEIFILAESLGGVESLIELPGAMTHASTAGSQLEVPDDLVRLSVGIEDIDDLIGDLKQALD